MSPTPSNETRASLPQAVAAGTLALFQAIALILATKFLLLLALSGAFWLANEAMEHRDAMSLSIVVAYCVLTIGPLSWLYVKGK